MEVLSRLARLSRRGTALGGSFAAAGFLQVLLVVSGVVVARSLGAEDRGYLALLVVVSGVCALVGGLGTFTAATFYIARDPGQARRIVASLLVPGLLQLAATVVLQGGALVFIVAGDPSRVRVAASISLLLAPGILAYGYGEAILLGQQRFTAFNVLRMVPTALYSGLVVAAFLLGAANLVLVMAIWTGGNLFGGALALGIAIRGLPKADEDRPIPARSTMTIFGLKSLVASLSPTEVFRLDQGVVGLFLSPVALGLYAVAQAFTNLPRAVASSIGYIAYPRIAAHPDQNEARRMMWRYFVLGVVISGAVVGALALVVGQLIRVFFGDDFATAAPIAQILLLGTFFSATKRVLTDGMRGLGYPGLGAVAEVVSWIVLLPAVPLLLPRYGATGVALALALAWAASLAVACVLAASAGRPGAAAGYGQIFGRSFSTLDFRLLLRIPRRSLLLGCVCAAVVLLSGAAVALLSMRGALLMILLLVAALLFGFGQSLWRRQLDRTNRRIGAASSHPRVQTRDARAPAFDTGRSLYYLGLAFLGLLTVRVSGQVTFSDVLFLFSISIAAAEIVVRRPPVALRLPALLLVGMALFSIGAVLSSFRSYDALKSVAVVVRLIFLTVFWFWLGTLVLSRLEHVRKAVVLWVASAALCGVGAILQLVAGDVIPNTSPIYGRSTGFTGQPNDLGGLTAIALVPALMLAGREGARTAERLAAYGFLLMVGAGLILSGSVGALIAAAAALFVWLVFQRHSAHSILAFLAIAGSAVAITTVQALRGAPTPIDRFHRVTAVSPPAGGGGSLNTRVATYHVAWRAIRKDPFLGVGLDLVSVTKPYGIVSYQYDVHNIIIGTWYKTGLFGLIGILLAIFAVLRTGWSAMLRSGSELERSTATALLSSFVAFIVFAMGAPVIFSRYGWISGALLLATHSAQTSAATPSHSPEFGRSGPASRESRAVERQPQASA